MESLLNEIAAAEFLSVSPATLRNWRCKGKGPAVTHVSRAVRYAPENLRQYVKARTRPASRLAEGARHG